MLTARRAFLLRMGNLWSSPADPSGLQLPEVDEAELARLVAERLACPVWRAKLEARLAPYRTKVTWRTLMQRVD